MVAALVDDLERVRVPTPNASRVASSADFAQFGSEQQDLAQFGSELEEFAMEQRDTAQFASEQEFCDIGSPPQSRVEALLTQVNYGLPLPRLVRRSSFMHAGTMINLRDVSAKAVKSATTGLKLQRPGQMNMLKMALGCFCLNGGTG